MSKRFFKSAIMFFRAMPSIIIFELLYKLFITAVALPALAYILQKAIDLSGVGYLTFENMAVFFSQPLSLLLVFLILVFCSVLTIVEISAIISGFAQLKLKRKISVFLMFKTGIRSIKKLFVKFNFILILYVLLILPATHLTLTSGIFVSVGLPDISFIFRTVNKLILIPVLLLIILITICLIRRIYCLHFFTLTNLGYAESVRRSKKITENAKLKTALMILLWTAFITFIFIFIFFVLCFLTAFAVRGFSQPEKAFFTTLRTIKKILNIFAAISTLFSTPVLFSFITSCFIDETGNDTEINLPEKGKISAWKIRTSAFAILTISLVMNYSFIKNVSSENIVLASGIFNTAKVTAHRGFSSVAPENTLPAFSEAVDVGADFIELDVQLSADGEIVVIHDDNLLRTAGIDVPVREKTYQELSELDFGEWFGEEFADTRIMRLEDVLELFSDKIHLNIEIKKTGDEMEVAERTALLLEEYGCEDTCYVTSFSYNALKTVKKTSPRIKTGLIANVMTYGRYTSLHYIDALSLNQRFVSQNLVNNIHINGKKVFVWTVNEQRDMERMMNMGVDNIITDNPDIAIKTVSSKGTEGYIISVLSKIFNY